MGFAKGGFAASLAGLFEPGDSIDIIGHSLGGALGGLLASGWFGVEVASTLALGVKTRWSEAEVVKGRLVAKTPIRWCDTRVEAEERFLRAAGLTQLAEKALRSPRLGGVEENGKFRVATDPAVYACAAMGMADILKTARRPLTFATGELDAMAPAADAEAQGLRAHIIPGAGHNAHVESPEAVWALFMASR